MSTWSELFADPWRMQMSAWPAELVDQIMKHRAGCPACREEIRAAEAVERVDVEMILEQLARVLGKKGVTFVNQTIRQFSELRRLVIRNDQLGWSTAGPVHLRAVRNPRTRR